MTRKELERILAVMGWLLALAAAGLLMFSSYAAFSWKHYTLIDYGRYTQLLWNCGHGRLFGVYVADTYLRTHLSFTLALLGPFFRIWDHPFLPSVLQWIMTVMGALMVAWTAGRRNVREDVVAAAAFFFMAYPLMQSALLSGFHGITLSVLFIPWLYACLTLRKGWVVLPLLLYAGLREDTMIVVIPMLLYFAVRDRWKAGYFWAAAGMVYGVAAMFYVFPMFGGTDLVHTRPINKVAILNSFAWAEIPPRLKALFWLCLPAVFFVRKKGWIPLLVFPSAALLVAMFSPVRSQHALRLQYSATVFVLVAVAMVEAVIRRPVRRGGLCECAGTALQAGRPALSAEEQRGSPFLAVILIVLTLAAYYGEGYLFGGRQFHRIYGSIHPDGRNLLKAARHIPREGVLICPDNLAGFCANRRDLLSWKVFALSSQRVDLAFFTLGNLGGRSEDRFYASLLNSREYGVIYFDGGAVILRRGAEPDRNPEIFKALDAMSHRTVSLPRTARDAGEEVFAEDCVARYWPGDRGRHRRLMLAYRNAVHLQPGAYEARFRLKTRKPSGSDLPSRGFRAKAGDDSWGILSVHPQGKTNCLALAEIERVDADPARSGTSRFRVQTLPFAISEPTDVEPRVLSGDAALWLDTVVFEPAP